VQQTPQRKQGMGVCSDTVISSPSDVLIVDFSIVIVLYRLVSGDLQTAFTGDFCIHNSPDRSYLKRGALI
jgi:hypothetical protein